MGYQRCHGQGRRPSLELRVRMGPTLHAINSQESNATLPKGWPGFDAVDYVPRTLLF